MENRETIRKAQSGLVETSELIAQFGKTCEMGNEGYVGNVNFLKMLQKINGNLAAVYNTLDEIESSSVDNVEPTETEIID
jgi:hypothetical protein